MTTDTPPAQTSTGITFRPHADVLADAAAKFQHDTSAHRMTVAHEDGLYRHLRFRDPSSSFYWFDLITWPGVLTVHGDMGTFVFSRTEDMFEFFRGARDINPGYWAEKLRPQHENAATEYSPDQLRAQVNRHVQDWVGDLRDRHGDDADAPIARLLEAIEADILAEDADESSARDALESFSHAGHEFSDVWEWELRDYSLSFLWCCHAVRWGIAQYDAAQQDAAASAAASQPVSPAA